MDNRLISMTDFVIQVLDNTAPINFIKGIESLRAYAQFLKQPLKLEMFVPVDKHGAVLEELKFCCSGPDCGCMGMPVNVGSQEEIDNYYKAKERVLFEGFDICYEGFSIIRVESNNKDGFPEFSFNKETGKCNQHNIVEEIVNTNIQLTTSALKQIQS